MPGGTSDARSRVDEAIRKAQARNEEIEALLRSSETPAAGGTRRGRLVREYLLNKGLIEHVNRLEASRDAQARKEYLGILGNYAKYDPDANGDAEKMYESLRRKAERPDATEQDKELAPDTVLTEMKKNLRENSFSPVEAAVTEDDGMKNLEDAYGVSVENTAAYRKMMNASNEGEMEDAFDLALDFGFEECKNAKKLPTQKAKELSADSTHYAYTKAVLDQNLEVKYETEKKIQGFMDGLNTGHRFWFAPGWTDSSEMADLRRKTRSFYEKTQRLDGAPEDDPEYGAHVLDVVQASLAYRNKKALDDKEAPNNRLKGPSTQMGRKRLQTSNELTDFALSIIVDKCMKNGEAELSPERMEEEKRKKVLAQQKCKEMLEKLKPGSVMGVSHKDSIEMIDLRDKVEKLQDAIKNSQIPMMSDPDVIGAMIDANTASGYYRQKKMNDSNSIFSSIGGERMQGAWDVQQFTKDMLIDGMKSEKAREKERESKKEITTESPAAQVTEEPVRRWSPPPVTRDPNEPQASFEARQAAMRTMADCQKDLADMVQQYKEGNFGGAETTKSYMAKAFARAIAVHNCMERFDPADPGQDMDTRVEAETLRLRREDPAFRRMLVSLTPQEMQKLAVQQAPGDTMPGGRLQQIWKNGGVVDMNALGSAPEIPQQPGIEGAEAEMSPEFQDRFDHMVASEMERAREELQQSYDNLPNKRGNAVSIAPQLANIAAVNVVTEIVADSPDLWRDSLTPERFSGWISSASQQLQGNPDFRNWAASQNVRTAFNKAHRTVDGEELFHDLSQTGILDPITIEVPQEAAPHQMTLLEKREELRQQALANPGDAQMRSLLKDVVVCTQMMEEYGADAPFYPGEFEAQRVELAEDNYHQELREQIDHMDSRRLRIHLNAPEDLRAMYEKGRKAMNTGDSVDYQHSIRMMAPGETSLQYMGVLARENAPHRMDNRGEMEQYLLSGMVTAKLISDGYTVLDADQFYREKNALANDPVCREMIAHLNDDTLLRAAAQPEVMYQQFLQEKDFRMQQAYEQQMQQMYAQQMQAYTPQPQMQAYNPPPPGFNQPQQELNPQAYNQQNPLYMYPPEYMQQAPQPQAQAYQPQPQVQAFNPPPLGFNQPQQELNPQAYNQQNPLYMYPPEYMQQAPQPQAQAYNPQPQMPAFNPPPGFNQPQQELNPQEYNQQNPMYMYPPAQPEAAVQEDPLNTTAQHVQEFLNDRRAPQAAQDDSFESQLDEEVRDLGKPQTWGEFLNDVQTGAAQVGHEWLRQNTFAIIGEDAQSLVAGRIALENLGAAQGYDKNVDPVDWMNEAEKVKNSAAFRQAVQGKSDQELYAMFDDPAALIAGNQQQIQGGAVQQNVAVNQVQPQNDAVNPVQPQIPVPQVDTYGTLIRKVDAAAEQNPQNVDFLRNMLAEKLACENLQPQQGDAVSDRQAVAAAYNNVINDPQFRAAVEKMDAPQLMNAIKDTGTFRQTLQNTAQIQQPQQAEQNAPAQGAREPGDSIQDQINKVRERADLELTYDRRDDLKNDLARLMALEAMKEKYGGDAKCDLDELEEREQAVADDPAFQASVRNDNAEMLYMCIQDPELLNDDMMIQRAKAAGIILPEQVQQEPEMEEEKKAEEPNRNENERKADQENEQPDKGQELREKKQQEADLAARNAQDRFRNAPEAGEFNLESIASQQMTKEQNKLTDSFADVEKTRSAGSAIHMQDALAGVLSVYIVKENYKEHPEKMEGLTAEQFQKKVEATRKALLNPKSKLGAPFNAMVKGMTAEQAYEIAVQVNNNRDMEQDGAHLFNQFSSEKGKFKMLRDVNKTKKTPKRKLQAEENQLDQNQPQQKKKKETVRRNTGP